jgi:hypothetical protein
MHRIVWSVLVACLLLPVGLAGCGRLASHALVELAKEEVGRNPRSLERLGEPLVWSSAITGRANEVDGIAAIHIPVSGPRTKGIVVVEGKKLGSEWGVTLLELRPETGEKVTLTADLNERLGTDTPKFDPSATSSPAAAAVPPPPAEIDIALPPGGPAD